MNNKELLQEYAEAVIELYENGDAMAVTQALAGIVNKLRQQILDRMVEPQEDRS